MNKEPFGKRVKYARKTLRGLSQRGLAQAITKHLRLEKPLSHSAVQKWEADRRIEATIETDNPFAIADICNLNARWLALGTGTRERWQNVTGEERQLLEYFRAMDEVWQNKLLSWAADAPKKHREPSLIDPFPHLKPNRAP